MVQALRMPLDWSRIVVGLALAIGVVVNLALLPAVFEHLLYGEAGRDFHETFAPVVHLENPYSVSYLWSPLAIPILSVIVPLGYGFWSLLHGLALLLIRPWWVAVAVGLSWPFWWDVASGNVGVFVLAAAWPAVRGNRLAIVVYLALCLLMPRPLMFPVCAWLLWQHPWTRIPFVVAGLAQLGIVAWIGLLDEWVAIVTSAGGTERLVEWNVGPSKSIGYPLWAAIFLPLAAWLTYRGRLGLASIAASPYLFPFYLLMLFLELRTRDAQERGRMHRRAASASVGGRSPRSGRVTEGPDRVSV